MTRPLTLRPPLLSLAVLLVAAASTWPAQAQSPLPFRSAEHLLDSLSAVATAPDVLDMLWDALHTADQIPFRLDDRVVFLYRGEAGHVAVAGDHTGWRASPGNALTRLAGTDLWYRTDQFPASARIDYKLVVDDEYILDPANPHIQVSGFGPNSELRMPDWRPSPLTVRSPDTPRGTLGPDRVLASEALGLSLTYRVYTPAGFDGQRELPVIYVTDGHEYADDDLGAVVIVLDNLITSGAMEPALAVFIDPRVDGENLRAELYLGNPAFATFVADELVPTIDAAHATRASREGRVILGTSFGGVFATYLGLQHPDVFGRLAIQSPAYWVSELDERWPGARLSERLANSASRFTVHLSTGTINDGEELTRTMRDAFAAGGHALTYREVPEGHSWGNWRALLADVFMTLLPPAASSAGDAAR